MVDSPGYPKGKVIMLGDSCVGKTSIVLQFYKGIFDPDSEPTIGAAYITKILHTTKGDLELNIWDTAGQEKFRNVVPMYLRGCSAAILVCSTDSEASCRNLENWLNLVRESSPDLQYVYIVLNKTDLQDTYDCSQAGEMAKRYNFQFFRVTAKNIHSLTPLFQRIGEDIIQHCDSNRIQFVNPSEDSQTTPNTGCC